MNFRMKEPVVFRIDQLKPGDVFYKKVKLRFFMLLDLAFGNKTTSIAVNLANGKIAEFKDSERVIVIPNVTLVEDFNEPV